MRIFCRRTFACMLLGRTLRRPDYSRPTPRLNPDPSLSVSSDQSLKVTWSDTALHQWQTVFSLDPAKPLITAITVDDQRHRYAGQTVVPLHNGKTHRAAGMPSSTFRPRTRKERGSSSRSFIPRRRPRGQWAIALKSPLTD